MTQFLRDLETSIRMVKIIVCFLKQCFMIIIFNFCVGCLAYIQHEFVVLDISNAVICIILCFFETRHLVRNAEEQKEIIMPKKLKA